MSRDPARITLADVRRAVNEGSPFSMHSKLPNPACPVGREIQGALIAVYDEAERVMEGELARPTIDGLLSSVQARLQA